jgi:hypothetical protein
MATTETRTNKKSGTLPMHMETSSGIKWIYFLLAGLTLFSSANAQNNATRVNLGRLTDYLFVFTDGSKDAKWQSSKFGYVGNVAINGLKAKESSSNREKIPYAGIMYSNDASFIDWQPIITYNATQASKSLNETSRITGLDNDLRNAFSQINSLTATPLYTSRSAMSLNGLNTMNRIAETFVINITSGFKVSNRIYITGDANDTYILRWDEDANPANGYQGTVKFGRGAAIIPMGDLKATNFIHAAGDISSSGGGTTPPAPYPQGPRTNFGKGALIKNGADFQGGGFFTGYWLTTGKDRNRETGSLSNATFVGGWYTNTTKFHLSRNSGGVYVGGQCANINEITGDNSVMAGTSISLQNLSTGGTWSSSNTSIATVNMNTGVVQGIAQGSVTIYYNTPNACASAIKNITVMSNRILKLGNLVWYDQNKNGKQDINEKGISGVKLNLYSDDNSDNVPDGIAKASTYTNMTGNYSFNNLLPGNYIVGMEMPAGYMPSMTTGTSNTPDNDNNTDNNGVTMSQNELRSLSISLVIGMEPTTDGDDNNGNLTMDFGLMGTGSIGNFVWSDTNGNGIQDGDIEITETGINNVPVTLTYPNGATESTYTNTMGAYSFTNLAPGTYSISFAKPMGYNSSPAKQGTNSNMDSDPVNGIVANINLNAGENNTSIDAGFQSTCLSLKATATGGILTNPNGTTTVTVEATGGLPPYTGTGNFTVSAGEYWFVVLDSYGCSSTAFIRVGPAAVLKVANPAANDATGNTDANGTITPSTEETSGITQEKVAGNSGIKEMEKQFGNNDNSFGTFIKASVYPNPCITVSSIDFRYAKSDAHATIEMYTMTGLKVATVFNENIKQDVTYRARIDAASFPSGTYIYRITCGNEMKNGRIIIN